MAQKLNSEFNYRTQVIGETPWAKLQTLLGFLEGRRRAKALEQVGALKLAAKHAELQHLKENGGLPHIILNLQAEILELESVKEDTYNAYRLNEQELEILERLIQEVREECEKTRIPGYTDEQMFEANAENEFTTNIIRDLQSEVLAYGRPSPAKIRNAMSCPATWKIAKQLGFVPYQAQIVTYLDGFGETLRLGYKEE